MIQMNEMMRLTGLVWIGVDWLRIGVMVNTSSCDLDSCRLLIEICMQMGIHYIDASTHPLFIKVPSSLLSPLSSSLMWMEMMEGGHGWMDGWMEEAD